MLIDMYMIDPQDAKPTPKIERSDVVQYQSREEQQAGMPELTFPRDGSPNDKAPDGHYEF